jgi:hypothetical protein
MTRAPQNPPKPVAGRWLCNTAEPSGEVSVGDVLRLGGTALACDPAGFREVPSELNEVRVSEHGTHPIEDT